MNNIFGFENLAAYQRAMDLVDKVYDLMKVFRQKNDSPFATSSEEP